jgi:hypothetical protein
MDGPILRGLISLVSSQRLATEKGARHVEAPETSHKGGRTGLTIKNSRFRQRPMPRDIRIISLVTESIGHGRDGGKASKPRECARRKVAPKIFAPFSVVFVRLYLTSSLVDEGLSNATKHRIKAER